MYDDLSASVAFAHRRDLLEAASRDRLAARATCCQPSRLDRLRQRSRRA
jgi:hypothetical protein